MSQFRSDSSNLTGLSVKCEQLVFPERLSDGGDPAQYERENPAMCDEPICGLNSDVVRKDGGSM